MASTEQETRPPRTSYPVFAGLGRKATWFGIPVAYFLGSLMGVAVVAMLFSLWLWGLLIIILPTLALMTREDDKAIDVLLLELQTRWRNPFKAFWRGSSYTPQQYSRRRPWRRYIRRSQ